MHVQLIIVIYAIQFCTVVAQVNRAGPRQAAQIELNISPLVTLDGGARKSTLHAIFCILSQEEEI